MNLHPYVPTIINNKIIYASKVFNFVPKAYCQTFTCLNNEQALDPITSLYTFPFAIAGSLLVGGSTWVSALGYPIKRLCSWCYPTARHSWYL